MRLGNVAVDFVSRVPARVGTKLLMAFLAMVGLLVLLGTVGLRVLSWENQQTEELIELQRKMAAYRQVQHDTTAQLYGVASALLAPVERVLDGVLRQLSQFGYDLDRLQYVARDEVELLDRVRQDYDRFIEIVTHAVELARAGQATEAREVQLKQAGPLADRLERLTNQLVNVAEADMLKRIEASQRAYGISRTVVVTFALGSIALALGLGYVFSWSLVGPVTDIEARLGRIAAGDFTQRVRIVNRDELGALAANVNRTCEELGRLYGQLQRSIAELRTLGEVSEAVNSSLELDKVLTSIAAHAASLAEADTGIVYSFDGADDAFHIRASHRLDPGVHERLIREPMPMGQGAVGRAGAERRPVQIADVGGEPGYTTRPFMLSAGYRAVLAVPLLRGETLVGGLVLCRKMAGTFAPETVNLVQTLANQSVLAIQNAELFQELERRSRELEALSSKLAKYLAPQVYASIFAGRQEVRLASQRKKLSVLFCDLVGFTETTERLESEDLTQLLNRYLTEMSRLALDHGATVDKYIGDAIMMFFGDPESRGVREDALACVRASLAMQRRMRELERVWRDAGMEAPLRCRIGISTAYCTVGNFGSEDRMDYTIVGAGVNIAARLEHAAPPGGILISHETYALVREAVCCRERGRIQAKGVTYPVAAYEVVDLYENLDHDRQPVREELANARIELDFAAMSEDERREAAAALGRALERLATFDPTSPLYPAQAGDEAELSTERKRAAGDRGRRAR